MEIMRYDEPLVPHSLIADAEALVLAGREGLMAAGILGNHASGQAGIRVEVTEVEVLEPWEHQLLKAAKELRNWALKKCAETSEFDLEAMGLVEDILNFIQEKRRLRDRR